MKRHREVPNALVSVNSSVGNLDVLLSTVLGALHALSHLILIKAYL